MTRPAALETFWALSDPVRIEILDRLAAGTQVTVTQLAGVLPISRQAVSRHVGTLEDAGLVLGEREGREHRYRLVVNSVDAAGRWLTARSLSWGRALDRLAAFVETGGGETP